MRGQAVGSSPPINLNYIANANAVIFGSGFITGSLVSGYSSYSTVAHKMKISLCWALFVFLKLTAQNSYATRYRTIKKYRTILSAS